MIPTDLASRLRLLIGTEVKALAPIEETHTDLPELQPGQRFSAKIENALPEGNFRAFVAGRAITLSMPGSAKSGDILQLVVTGNNDKTISAKLADASLPASTGQAKLSPAGQLISQLLTGRHLESQGTTLNRNEPLLSEPPTRAASLTPLLRQAVSESGLFYEAHQAQWVEGEASLESLLREPQAQGNTSSATSNSPNPSLQNGQGPASQGGQIPAQPGAQQNTPNEAAARNALQASSADAGQPETTQASHSGALKIAEQLMPIVHQQLETLATHQALWQGQVWPGQTMQWEIFDPQGQPQSSGGQGDDGEAAPWQSTLRLKMPHLGGIEAQLIITPAGVAIRVSADSANTAQQLQDGSEALGNALDAAGVPLTGFAVQLGGPREARS